MVVVCCIVNYLFCYVDVNSECLCIFSGEPENVSSYQNFAICDHTVLYDGPNPKRWRWTCVKKRVPSLQNFVICNLMDGIR